MGFFKSITKPFKKVLGGGGGSLLGGLAGTAFGGPLGGMLGSQLGGMLGGGGRGDGGASNYLNQIPGMSQGMFSPYVAQGNEAYNRLLDQYGNASTANPNQFPGEYRQMARDPGDFVNNLMKGYEPSRGYNYKQNQMLGAARNSAASGGFAGTKYDQGEQADLVKNLLSSDMGEYLNRVMGTQREGLAGEERRISGLERALGNRVGQGFNASTDLASILGTNLANQAGLSWEQQRQKRLDSSMNKYNTTGMFANIWNSGRNGGSSTQNRLFGGLF